MPAQPGDGDDVHVRILRVAQRREANEVLVYAPFVVVWWYRLLVARERCAQCSFAVCRDADSLTLRYRYTFHLRLQPLGCSVSFSSLDVSDTPECWFGGR